jgi:hypothetical protein
MRSPGEEIPRKAGCRRERTKKRLQMEASTIAHAWLTPAISKRLQMEESIIAHAWLTPETFLVVRETLPKEHLSVIRSER